MLTSTGIMYVRERVSRDRPPIRIFSAGCGYGPEGRSHLFLREAIDLNFKMENPEGATVYKIVYSDVTEKPETRLSY